MTNERRILLAGGYGVFGRHLARELLETTDASLVIAGRDFSRATAARFELDARRTECRVLDLRDASELTRAAEGCFAVACTAGPFQRLPHDLPLAATRAGAHWLDIADDPNWVLPLLADRELDAAAREAGLVAAAGLSTVPAVSGLLGRYCLARLPGAHRARVTLFIGNRNRKGTGATASALIAGFRDPVPVDLPFGRRLAYLFPTPDTDLFRRDLRIQAEFRVALEWGFLGWTTAALGRLTSGLGLEWQTRFAGLLSAISEPFSTFGIERGCVQVDAWDGEGGLSAAAVAGQRLVVLPCALALSALLAGELRAAGTLHPAAWLPHDEYLGRLQSRGVQVVVREGARPRPGRSP